jgi:CreA protein
VEPWQYQIVDPARRQRQKLVRKIREAKAGGALYDRTVAPSELRRFRAGRHTRWPVRVAGHRRRRADLIFKRSTVFKWLTPDDKLATYGLDDPEVDGVACHFTVPEKGGLKGWIGIAEEVSDISLACRQIGPIRFKKKFEQGEDVFRTRRSLFFKKMQIVRGCDTKRNVLVYMVYSDKLIDGSPKNSTSTVPVMPWGAGDEVQKCADWLG